MAVDKKSIAIFTVCNILLITATAVIVLLYVSSNKSDSTTHLPLTSQPSIVPTTKLRLPDHLRPLSYVVKVLPYIVDNSTIDGQVTISLICTAEGRNVTLHILNITIDEPSVVLSEEPSGRIIDIDKHSYDLEKQLYILILKEDLQVGKNYTLSIDYQAVLSSQLTGFYLSTYNESGKKKYLAATQFEPTYARKAFPCFDEPAFKATFKVILGRRKSWTALSNMPVEESVTIKGRDNWAWDHFVESVPMSTYLLAFVICEFAYDEVRSSTGTIFRVWTRPEILTQAKYASRIGPSITEFYEGYFNISYPLPKQDMIGLPDFSAGAMENWGLITYRETRITFDPKVGSAYNKQRIALVIAHEIAHQWFGNLVTPKWWNDLWLNEGFATYMEYLGTEAVEPSWKIKEQFLYIEMFTVLRSDSISSTHAISQPVDNPEEIDEIFDEISYQKGSSVIHMMNAFLSEETFIQGIRNYLKNKAYQNSDQAELWDFLTEQASKDKKLPHYLKVKDIMDTWTLQPGYPVVLVTRNYKKKTIEIEQKKFQLNHTDSADGNEFWWVPLTWTTEDNASFDVTTTQRWLGKSAIQLTASDGVPEDTSWILFNLKSSGYYRVNYDEQNWQLLYQSLLNNHEAIHVLNRARLLSDGFALAEASLINYEVALNLTHYLPKEKEFGPLKIALSELDSIRIHLSTSELYGLFQEYSIGLMKLLYSEVDWDSLEVPEDGNYADVMNIYRTLKILSWSCRMEYSSCLHDMLQKVRTWMDNYDPNNNPINPNLKSIAYITAVRFGTIREWNFFWEHYRLTNDETEKRFVLEALCSAKDPWKLQQLISRSLSDKHGIRLQDAASVLSNIAKNEYGTHYVFKFLKTNWLTLQQYLGRSRSLDRILNALGSRMNTELEHIELMNLRTVLQERYQYSSRAMNQAVETVALNVRWMNEKKPQVEKWLMANKNYFSNQRKQWE